jgi:hypothetical protein
MSAQLLSYAPMFADKLLCRYVVESIRGHLVDEDVSILELHLIARF